MTEPNPSLYEMLLQNFAGELDLHRVSEQDWHTLSVLDNLQRILNCRAGTLSHLPDYGLPDMGTVLQGLPATAHTLMRTMTNTLLKYEPRLAELSIELLPQAMPGHLECALDGRLKGGRRVVFGTTLGPEGKVLVRHLAQQNYLSMPLN
ncbi:MULTISPECIES: type VI secretion system baseplate subunit TssE [Pseudomonas]|jgi:type VI secretion system protein|uniref:Type VI secretion system lysozyme-like protein n=1 Tax=Pseudomonas frederiksbergensis TaxID=104087 RepID=A0A0B1ZAL1_9PSED|nr:MULTISPECIES: type VI secretion system baseplate subunit TssE [Pseudomonas]KHK66256.1 type VI secretion system lysozyme-like protein [Pseudomonas frederiksbergensis]KJH85544.1 type VI secretion system lysozyme-like protein [Pseudomonas fluorescens]MBI6618280.1 type VI secretion system baseplate subunit TssE [Pseudomonas corrugata]MBI6694870.1 type VI secretion system baseplate subunit TssE [Pseudomonas corrugata]WRV70775.1 type VI secretion system baseplate subunit TssE [Pseudomonas frederi